MPDQLPGKTGHLSRLLADFESAGVRPTPLALISKATDEDWSDAQISDLVDELAAQRHLDEVAA